MTATTTSLEDYLAVPFSDELPEVAPTIGGEAEASATLRRLAILREKIAVNQHVADNETSKIQEWEREVNAPLERQATFFEGILNAYMRHVRDASGDKTKSISLPGGTIKTTAKQPKWNVEDVAEFVKWARAQKLTALYEVRYVPATLATIKKTFVDDGDGNIVNPDGGELVPGLSITPPDAPYSITITTKES